MDTSASNNVLMNTLKSVDISNIEYIKFSINRGEKFIVKTDNIKRLAIYVSELKNTTTFSAGELNEVYNFVTQYLTTDVPEDVVKIISERLKLFCEKGGKVFIQKKSDKNTKFFDKLKQFNSRQKLIDSLFPPYAIELYGFNISSYLAYTFIQYIFVLSGYWIILLLFFSFLACFDIYNGNFCADWAGIGILYGFIELSVIFGVSYGLLKLFKMETGHQYFLISLTIQSRKDILDFG